MAKLTIEIDTGVLAKVDRIGAASTARSQSTIRTIVGVVQEAIGRMEKMGVNANGVVLYGRGGPCGRITLTGSDQRKGESRNWYDDTVGAGVPLSERRWSDPVILEGNGKPMRSKFKGKCIECKGVIAKGAEIEFLSGVGAWHEACRPGKTGRSWCQQLECYCHDVRCRVETPYCGQCGCRK